MIINRTAMTLAIISILMATAAATAQTSEYVNVDGVQRRYVVHVPDGFDGSESLPVLFHFHGGGSTPEGEVSYIDFRPLVNSENFIAVYPAGLPSPGEPAPGWNSLGPYDNGNDDLGFVESMIDAMVKEYNADRDRMYACGFSWGANFQFELYCYLSDRMAAVVSVAAGMWEWTRSDCNPTTPTGVMSIHGTNDSYNPYNGNAYNISFNALNEFLVAENGATTPPTTETTGNRTHYTWSEGEDCFSVEHIRVQNGGHDWPSFANQAIWEFVSQYDINGVIGCGDEPLPGDINGDGIVDGADMGLMLLYWGQCDNCPADLDGDGEVSGADVGLLLVNWT